jgi:uncharacterized membrane protein
VIATPLHRPPYALAIFLIVGGAIGWYSSFALTLDKIAVLTNPDTTLGCNFSLVVQCGKNLGSWQGSVFGFSNPLIGLGGFVAPIAVGTALLAGASFARWFWIVFNLGIAGAFAFVVWLLSQSIFSLGTLCPWCMVVWSVTIPMFWAVTLYNLSAGHIPSPPALQRFAAAARSWVPLISLVCYLTIAVMAQLRLDVLAYL